MARQVEELATPGQLISASWLVSARVELSVAIAWNPPLAHLGLER